VNSLSFLIATSIIPDKRDFVHIISSMKKDILYILYYILRTFSDKKTLLSRCALPRSKLTKSFIFLQKSCSFCYCYHCYYCYFVVVILHIFFTFHQDFQIPSSFHRILFHPNVSCTVFLDDLRFHGSFLYDVMMTSSLITELYSVRILFKYLYAYVLLMVKFLPHQILSDGRI